MSKIWIFIGASIGALGLGAAVEPGHLPSPAVLLVPSIVIFFLIVINGLFVMADSAQFGDNPDLDGILEYFPEGFHEPYYKGYLSYDFAPVMAGAGFTAERKQMAFLKKVSTWRREPA